MFPSISDIQPRKVSWGDNRSLGLPCYITLINSMAHSRDVDDTTHDRTRHYSAGTFVLLLVCMSSCSVFGWWMSSWCVTASPLHGEVRGVFDGSCVRFMLHFHVAPCLYVVMLNKFVHSWKVHVRPFVYSWTHLHMFVRPYIREHIFAWSFVHKYISLHASFVLLFANMSFCMYSLFSSHSSSCHVCLCTYICSQSWRDDIKSINLLVYLNAWSFHMQATRREDKEGYETTQGKLIVGMEASGTTSENCVEVTGGWWQKIWIDSDYVRGLARLEDKSAQPLGGVVRAAGAWLQKLCNSLRELAIGCRELGKKKCAIPRGNWQQATGSMAAKTAQFLERTGNGLLGTAGWKKLH